MSDECPRCGSSFNCYECIPEITYTQAEIDQLRAENERLREALKGCAADLERHARDQFDEVWWESDFESLLSPYRAALQEADR